MGRVSMFGPGKFQRSRTGHRVTLRNEKGLAMVEYAPILAVIALALFFSVSYFGPWVYDQFIDASIPLYGDAGCPEGSYDLIRNPPPANGVDRDLNVDDWYCMKDEANAGTDLPGNGNSNKASDIKDNNRPNP
jgi:Flp pilus assembly pilin Flp